MSRIHTPPTPWLHLVLAVTLILAGSPSCSDDPAAPEEPADTQVSVESSNRETATVGAGGGSVSATSNAGVTYTLDIPAGALPGDVEIAITPVTSIQSLPFAGRLEGAVRLGPSGLQLFKPAVLTIARAPSTTGTERLVGFSYEGDAASFEPAATIDGVSEMRVLVSHFSGAGAASSESADDWLATMCASVPTLDWPISSQFECWDGVEPQRDWFIRFARDYLEDILTPLAQGGGEISVAVTEYIEWYHACDQLAERFQATDWETVFADEITTIQELLETELVASVAEAKTALCAQGGVENLRLLLEYRHLVFAAGFEETTGLRDEDILADLCAEVRIPELTLVDPMPMNQGVSLDARAELLINGQRTDAVFNFTVQPKHATSTCAGGLDLCGGRSNGLGEYTVVATRVAQGLVEIDVFANLVMSLFVTNPSGAGYSLMETPLLGAETIIRESYSIAATFPDFIEPGEPATLRAVVTRDNPGGSPTPVEGAIVTFTVDGGVANPVGGLTDATGAIETQITADQQESRIVIRIDASANGAPIATRNVERALNQPITLVSRRSTAAVINFSGAEGCSQTGNPLAEDDDFGPSTLNAGVSATCSAEGETSSISGTMRVTSDTGVATDGRSALMTFDSNMTLSTAITSCEVSNCFGNVAGADGSFVVTFYVNSPVSYSFNVTSSGNPPGDVSNFSVASLRGPSGSVAEWNSEEPNVAVSGILPTGSYELRFRPDLVMYPPSGSGTYGMTGSLQLDPAPAAVTRNQ